MILFRCRCRKGVIGQGKGNKSTNWHAPAGQSVPCRALRGCGLLACDAFAPEVATKHSGADLKGREGEGGVVWVLVGQGEWGGR